MSIEDKLRIRWSDFPVGQPIRLVIKNWKGLKRYFFNKYLLVDVLLEYKARRAQLCVPYSLFVNKVRKLPVDKQKLIVSGRAVIELEKTFRGVDRGMRIGKVEEYNDK